MPTSSTQVCAIDLKQLRTQNEQLWKIIDRQRTNILALQKENSFLIAERDGLQYKLLALKRSQKHTPTEVAQATVETDEQSPMPPTRSPYRANNNNKLELVPQHSSLSTTKDTMLQKETKPPVKVEGSPLLLSSSTTELSPSHVVPVSGSPMDDITSSSLRSHSPPVIITEGTILSMGRQLKRKSQVFASTTPALPGMDAPTLSCVDTNTVDTLDNQRPLTTTTSSPLPPLPPQHIYNLSSVSSSVSSFSSSVLSPDTSSTSLTPSNVSNGIRSITVKVLGSNIRQNDKAREVVSFIISIGKKPDEDGIELEELWRVEKLYSHFLELDCKIKNQSIDRRIAKLPDKALFTTHSPSKVDRRKAALEHYLQHILLLPLDDNSDLCEFLSTNIVDSSVMYSRTGRKEGYLTKRGKNFGGWKTRYFVLHGSSLEYYDTKEGNHLGTIRLVNAQIGRQTPGAVDDGSTIYRHAFLIVEQKRSGSSYLSRHILCADSDQDRDSWVDALFKVVNTKDEKQRPSTELPTIELAGRTGPPTPSKPLYNNSLSPIQHTNLDHYPNFAHQRPTHQLTRRSSMVNLLNPNGEDEIILPPRAISPSPAFNRQSDDLLGNDLSEKKSKHKRMTFWGKKMFNSNSNDDLTIPSRTLPSSTTTTDLAPSGFRGFRSRPSHETGHGAAHKGNTRRPPVFGIPLDESVQVSRVSESYQLPSIVFRCIEYLDAKKAVLEEGLYRLSGSNMMIKSLKQRFDMEGDINLVAEKEEYDVHAVAGLLKMWLRELPTNVLTREHRMDFLHVIDLLDHKDRVNELGRLVSLLPITNYTLLRALTAHLIQVIQHSDVNKMTLRNVSIVFSPTLGIPGTIFHLLLTEFDYIFWTKDDTVKPNLDENTSTKATIDPAMATRTIQHRDGRSNRNSVTYRESAPDSIVDLEKHQGQQLVLEYAEDEMGDLVITDEEDSIILEDDLRPTAFTG